MASVLLLVFLSFWTSLFKPKSCVISHLRPNSFLQLPAALLLVHVSCCAEMPEDKWSRHGLPFNNISQWWIALITGAGFSCNLWYRKLVKRIVTPSLIERLNVNLYVSTIRLRLWHGGLASLTAGASFLIASSSSSSSEWWEEAAESQIERRWECFGEVEECRSQWTDQWKSLYGTYRLARSWCDGCVVAGNGPLYQCRNYELRCVVSLVDISSQLLPVHHEPGGYCHEQTPTVESHRSLQTQLKSSNYTSGVWRHWRRV